MMTASLSWGIWKLSGIGGIIGGKSLPARKLMNRPLVLSLPNLVNFFFLSGDANSDLKLLQLSFKEFDDLCCESRQSSTGPDGIPYSVWKSAPLNARRDLYKKYLHLFQGQGGGPDFNECWFFYWQRVMMKATLKL